MRCLVLGATGYVGRRLVPPLSRAGHEVRCLVRSPQDCGLDAASGIEIVTGDVHNDADVRAAMVRIDVVYYLVHALGQHDFPASDRYAAVPLIPLPGWAESRRIQPIAIADVLHYLPRSATLPDTINRTFDIGGLDIVSYRQLIQRYARAAGLPQPVSPASTARPHPAGNDHRRDHHSDPSRVARPLIESLAHDMICREHEIIGAAGAA